MRNISDLLKRFTNSLNKDAIARGAIAEAILTSTGIKILPENISLKDGVLSISAGAAAKNEMRLKEERIVETARGIYNIHITRVIYK